MLTRPTCEWLQERRNEHIPSGGWSEPRNIWLYSLPFSIKEAWILTQVRWFSGAWVHHLLGLLAFWIKSLFLAPAPRLSFIGLLCGEQYKLGLSNKNTEVGEALWGRNALEAVSPSLPKPVQPYQRSALSILLPLTKSEAHPPPDLLDIVMPDLLKFKI